MAGVAALAAAGVAGCGGSSSPHVASLGNSDTKSSVSTTTLPKGNPTQLLDEWASCMRANGVPDMADPTITSSGAIHIEMPADASPNAAQSIGGPGAGGPCNSYLQAASQALRGGQPLQKPDPAKLLKFSECMQKSGFPQFPDPSPGGGLSLQIQPGQHHEPQQPGVRQRLGSLLQEGRRARLSATRIAGRRGHPSPERLRPQRRAGRQRRGRRRHRQRGRRAASGATG